jgi:alpha-amylase
MVDQNDRTKTVGEMHNIEGWTKYVHNNYVRRWLMSRFEFPGRGDKYSKMKWNYNHFTGVDYDAKTETKAIFKVGTFVLVELR